MWRLFYTFCAIDFRWRHRRMVFTFSFFVSRFLIIFSLYLSFSFFLFLSQIYVATTDCSLHAYRLKGRKDFTLKMPALVTQLEVVQTRCGQRALPPTTTIVITHTLGRVSEEIFSKTRGGAPNEKLWWPWEDLVKIFPRDFSVNALLGFFCFLTLFPVVEKISFENSFEGAGGGYYLTPPPG